jgi:hypothetical protein
MSTEAFGQNAYVTSLNEPGMTIASAPDSTTILSLHNVPAGNYVINAKLNVTSMYRYSEWVVRCWIASSTEMLDVTESPLIQQLVIKEAQPLPLQAFVALSAPDTISLVCNLIYGQLEVGFLVDCSQYRSASCTLSRPWLATTDDQPPFGVASLV